MCVCRLLYHRAMLQQSRNTLHDDCACVCVWVCVRERECVCECMCECYLLHHSATFAMPQQSCNTLHYDCACMCVFWACECERERQQVTLRHCLSSGVAQKVALIAQKVVQCTIICIEQFGFPSSNPHCSLTDHNARSNIQLLMIAQHSFRMFTIYHVALRKLHTDLVARSNTMYQLFGTHVSQV